MASTTIITRVLGLIGCLSWAAAVGIVSVVTWEGVGESIGRTRDDGRTFCVARYPEPDARARCADLFDVQFVKDRNTAIATRAIVAGLPLAAFGCWLALSYRRARR